VVRAGRSRLAAPRAPWEGLPSLLYTCELGSGEAAPRALVGESTQAGLRAAVVLSVGWRRGEAGGGAACVCFTVHGQRAFACGAEFERGG
jgi:hypothetical protein